MDGEEMTFDEILQDPKYQAEFDKRVQKALEKSNAAKEEEWKKREAELANREDEIRKNILEEMEAKQKEAEENAKLTEAEKYKKEMDKLAQSNLEMKNQLAIINREKKMRAYIKDKGYDAEAILEFVKPEHVTDTNYADEIDKTNTLFSERVSKGVNDKLKEDPDVLLGNKGKKEGPEFNFGFTPIKPVEK
jgi:hypothetical protein